MDTTILSLSMTALCYNGRMEWLQQKYMSHKPSNIYYLTLRKRSFLTLLDDVQGILPIISHNLPHFVISTTHKNSYAYYPISTEETEEHL